jgi:hypothetical protein
MFAEATAELACHPHRMRSRLRKGYAAELGGPSRLQSSWSESSSRPEEFHPQALPEPCMNLSIHTAPDVRPLP